MLTQVQSQHLPRMWRLDELEPGRLSIPTRDDLISMKAFAISERQDEAKRDQDLNGIEVLLEMFPGPLSFPGSAHAEANRAFVKTFVPMLSRLREWPERK